MTLSAMKEHSLSSVTEEQRRAGQKDQDLVCKILVVWALNTLYLSSGRTYSRPAVISQQTHLTTTNCELRNKYVYLHV